MMANKLNPWSRYIGAVVALLLVSGLLLVVIMVGANLIQSLSINAVNAADWKDQHTVQATYIARTILNLYYVICGIIFLGLFFLMEHQLVTTGVPRRRVLRRTFFALGVELLILALMQLARSMYTPVIPLYIRMSIVEFLVSIGFIYLGRRKAPISQ